MNSQGLKQNTQDQHGPATGPLYIYTIAFSSVLLWDSWICKLMHLWFLCLLLGHFFSCWLGLSSLEMIAFACLITLFFVMFCCYHLQAYSFLMGDKNEVNSFVRNWEDYREGKLYSDYVVSVKNLYLIKEKKQKYKLLIWEGMAWKELEGQKQGDVM